MYPVQQTSERLLLRELTVEDVDAVHAIYGSPQVTEHLSFEPRTRQQVVDIINGATATAAAQPRSEYMLAVCLIGSHEMIGVARLARLALDPHSQQAATIGFALRPDVWSVGYGTETVRTLLTLGFNGLDLHRIWAARAPGNDASDKTLRRAGMVEEGRIRHHVFVRGSWRDSVTYAAIESEWRDATGVSP